MQSVALLVGGVCFVEKYTIKMKIGDTGNGVTPADRVTVSKTSTRTGTGNKHFFYFALIWMFYNRNINTKINNLQFRALRMVHQHIII